LFVRAAESRYAFSVGFDSQARPSSVHNHSAAASPRGQSYRTSLGGKQLFKS